jgi:type IV secretory pathway VirB2 component (pilin)
VVKVNVRKIVGFLALALLIFFVITQPGSAANSLQGIGNFLQNAANSLVTFFSAILPAG